MVKDPTANAGDTTDLGLIPDWEDPLKEGMATHSYIFAWIIQWTRNLAGYSPWGHKELDMTEAI